MRILVSAYACEPDKGSEPGVGWHVATGLSERHDVWVLTRSNNRSAIEDELAVRPRPRLRVLYHDLPAWVLSMKRGLRGVQLYYYLWQLSARRCVRAAVDEHSIQVCHHATFAKYWGPSAIAWSGVPYVMGPLGGGDVVPRGLESVLAAEGRVLEFLRTCARLLAERDPFVRRAVRGASICIGATSATTDRLRALGARQTATWNQVGVNPQETPALPEAVQARIKVVCAGRLVPLKAVTLALEAIAKVPCADLEVVGDGPERSRLQERTSQLGIAGRVRFLGTKSYGETLVAIKSADVLLHPSLHDSGGMVCAEALSVGRPVVALRWAGPAQILDDTCGILVNPMGGASVVASRLASAIAELASDRSKLRQFGVNGLARVESELSWRRRIDRLEAYMDDAIAGDS
ncbi:MAG: glycosyltransferase family 4 protein [Actinobacteria bacterium]|nr:glycosyltransferase family 4 protein [Actinomycetota bacterium]MCG2808701.1 glycosyltransferase family 4 protein [Coriobacteriia bacterium]